MTAKTILVFGETLWDLLPTGPVLGGAPCNFAYRLKELGENPLLVTRLGRDDLGLKARDQLSDLGMDIRLLQWDDKRPTGTVTVIVDAQGKPDYTIHRDVAYDGMDLTEALLEAAVGADALCFGTLSQRSLVTRSSLARVMTASDRSAKILDINLRKDCYSQETVTWSLEHADVLKLNDEEVKTLGDLLGFRASPMREACASLQARFTLSHIVVTLGERGAYARSSDGEEVYVPGFRVPVADTVGSGDAFGAAFAHGLLQGSPLVDCCRLGTALGAIVASQCGPTVPVAKEVIEALMTGGRERVIEPALESIVSL